MERPLPRRAGGQNFAAILTLSAVRAEIGAERDAEKVAQHEPVSKGGRNRDRALTMLARRAIQARRKETKAKSRAYAG